MFPAIVAFMRRAWLAIVMLVACRSKPGTSVAEASAPEVRAEATEDAGMEAGTRSERWVELHVPGWIMDQLPPAEIDLEDVTDVVAFGAVPTGAGSLELGPTGLTPAKIAALRAHAAQANARLLLCVGGEKTGARFERLSAGAVLEQVERFGFDGVELDIEPLSAVPAPKLSSLVRELSARLRPGRTLSAAILPREAEIALLAPFARDLDRVAIMGYVDAISREREQALLAALVEAGFPRGKLGIGIDRKTSEPRRRAGAAGGVLLWEAGALCRGRGRPCAPAALLSSTGP